MNWTEWVTGIVMNKFSSYPYPELCENFTNDEKNVIIYNNT